MILPEQYFYPSGILNASRSYLNDG
uniref:Uncharacterized protein n=1 Tax=Rhizophora mucronata TaxID=61149 RepID=A0A2P2NJX3_RHIMU